MKDLTTVIVTHNSASELPGCVESIRAHADGCRLEIIVVDSGSTDGTADVARQLGLRPISCANIGYGAGNNVGWRAAQPARYLFVLNPDATIVEGSLADLVAYADQHPTVAVFAPVLVGPGREPLASISRVGSGARGLVERARGGTYEPVTGTQAFDWAWGCALFIRGEFFDQVSGFDERFFLYAEEQDLQRSSRRQGWMHETWPLLTVCHDHAGKGPNPDPRVYAQRFRATLTYARKWGGPPGVLVRRAALAVDLLRRIGLGTRADWTESDVAALRVLLTERIPGNPRRAREVQRARTLGTDPGEKAPRSQPL